MLTPNTMIAERYLLEASLPCDLAAMEMWSGRDTELDRPVQVVIWTGDLAETALKGARGAAALGDPHFPPAYDLGDDETSDQGSFAYLVTAPPRGRRLDDVIRSGLLTTDQTRAIVGEAATAMSTAAEAGIHHLALRPECVRLDTSSTNAQVIITGLGADGALLGATSSSPALSDTRALAALGYYCLTGRWAGKPLPDGARNPSSPPPLRATASPDGGPADLSELVPHADPALTRTLMGSLRAAPAAPATAAELAETIGSWEPVAATGALPVVATPVPSAETPVPQPPSVSPMASGRIPRIIPAPPVAAANLHQAGVFAPISTGVPPTSVAPASAVPAPDGLAPTASARPIDTPAPRVTFAPVAAGTPQTVLKVPRQPKPQRGVRPAPIVIPLVLAVIFGGTVWAASTLRNPPAESVAEATASPTPLPEETDGVGSATGPGAPEAPTPTPTPTLALPVISGTNQVGEAMDCPGEQPETAYRATDGDPTSYWYTCRYNQPVFGGFKTGEGLELTLREPALVNSVSILTDATGGIVQIRATSAANPTGGTLLAEGPFSNLTVFDFAEPVELEELVVWITELPPAEVGFQVHLFEITVE